MIVATHQPNLLPYPGIWAKMAEADLFGITTDVKLDYGGFQNRVPLGNGWLTVGVSKDAKNQLIRDVRLADAFRCKVMLDTLQGRMSKKKYPFLARLDLIKHLMCTLDEERTLVAINCTLNAAVAMLLNMGTAFRMTPVAEYQGETKHDRLFERLDRICPDGGTYIAGRGTAAYLEPDRIPSKWEMLVQQPIPSDKGDSDQSVLHFLAKYEDPLTEMKSRFRLVPLAQM